VKAAAKPKGLVYNKRKTRGKVAGQISVPTGRNKFNALYRIVGRMKVVVVGT
jgi:hypothetical protein